MINWSNWVFNVCGLHLLSDDFLLLGVISVSNSWRWNSEVIGGIDSLGRACECANSIGCVCVVESNWRRTIIDCFGLGKVYRG